jgi:hypothetical protein
MDILVSLDKFTSEMVESFNSGGDEAENGHGGAYRAQHRTRIHLGGGEIGDRKQEQIYSCNPTPRLHVRR